MLATSVSSDVWIGTALIAAITVLSCLGFICTRLRYEREFIDVVAGAKSLRDKIVRQLDQAGTEAAMQPSRMERIAGSAGFATPTPDLADSEDSENSQDSADSDGRAETQANIEIERDAEIVAPDSAEAA